MDDTQKELDRIEQELLDEGQDVKKIIVTKTGLIVG